jgi:predicted Zn-dependent peptidase
MVFSIAGNFQSDLIDGFEGFKHGRRITKEPNIRYTPSRTLILKEKEDLQQIHLLLGIEAPSRINDDFETLQVLNTVLSGGMSSRLFHEIREKKGLVYSIDTGLISYPLGGVFYLYSATTGEKIIPLVEELKKQISFLVQNGISESELSYGKERLKGKLLLSTESTYATMMRNLDTGIAFGKPLSVNDMEKRIESVTAEKIHEAMERYFVTPWIVSMVVPNKSCDTIRKTDLFANGCFSL